MVKKFPAVEEAISKVEEMTRSEVVVHISRAFWLRNLDSAVQRVVRKYGLCRTTERNAVLVFVNPRRRRIAIWGDEGIHAHLGDQFWTNWITDVTNQLKQNPENIDTTLSQAILKLAPILKSLFPPRVDGSNPNELSNQVTTES